MEYPNWFAGTALPNFEQFLGHLKDVADLNFLQLGAFTGDASVWLAENILTGTDCILMDVDTWQGSDEDIHKTFDWSQVLTAYVAKTLPYSQIHQFVGTTERFFATNDKTFDFIYVDADHTALAAYNDGVNAWKILKPGGILAFDDYTWGDGLSDQTLAPKPGINKFLDRFKGWYETLLIDSQVWIRKL